MQQRSTPAAHATLAMDAADWSALGLLSVLWGGSFLFYKVLASELPPLTTVLGRVAIGAAVLVLALSARGVTIRVPRVQWGRFVVLALLTNVIPFTLYAWGETRVSSGTASILNAMTPIFTVLVTGLVLRTEKLTGERIAGIACGFAGVAVLVGPEALIGQDMLGQFACLLAPVCYGFGTPWGRRITGLTPPQIACGQLITSTLLTLPMALIADRPWTLASPSLAGWGALLGIAVLSTALAYILFFRILARAGATNLTLVTFLVPVTALALGYLILGERITAHALGGVALIACGLAAIDGRLLRFRR